MSTLSEDIQISFSNVLKVYEDISTLLQDADAFMEKAGYKCLHGNETITEGSRSIVYPTWWIYPYFARYYQNAEKPHEVKGIGIFFLNPQQVVISPVILFGVLIMSPEGIRSRRYGAFLKDGWFKNVREQSFGKFYRIEKIQYTEYGEIQGIPLEAIGNTRDLEKYVIDPLVSNTL